MVGQGLPAMIERSANFTVSVHRPTTGGPGNFLRVGLNFRLQLQDMGMIRTERHTQFVVEPL